VKKKKRSETTSGDITCHIFTKGLMRGTFDEEWETTLFRQTTNKTVEVRDTAIRGEFRDGSMARADSEDECLKSPKTSNMCVL
jgi:hypothetical protein